MKISLREINEAWNILYNKAIELGINEIETENDYYWSINSENRVDFKSEPPKTCVGSLMDDWESLKKVLVGDNQVTIIDFDRVAHVIIEVGEQIHKSDIPFV